MDVSKTKFASPQRSSREDLIAARTTAEQEMLFIEALNIFPEVVLMLDQNRQVVYSNQRAVRFLGMDCVDDLIGRRPGEIFHCIHSGLEEAGCGTSEFCRECGGIKSILTAQEGRANSQECRMRIRNKDGEEESLDLRVWAVPMELGKDRFVLLTVKNIMDEKRRESLERTFFHDILNDAGVLMLYSQNVRDGIVSVDEDSGKKMNLYAQRLIEAISVQRDLLAAESGSFESQKSSFSVQELLDEIIEFARDMPLAQGKRLQLIGTPVETRLHTDRVILRRILINLVKNALEASEQQDEVRIGYDYQGQGHCFSVSNQSVMSPSVRLQIFQRSFSTRGSGRGIGLYSVKLFTERYLEGEVSFSSSDPEGTVFCVTLPE